MQLRLTLQPDHAAQIGNDEATLQSTKLQSTKLQSMVAIDRLAHVAQSFLLGRLPGSLFQLQDLVVSGHHADVLVEADGFYLVDQQSTNGTFVNGARIDRVLLRNGDVIQLGAGGPFIAVSLHATDQLAVSALGEGARLPHPPPPQVMPQRPSQHLAEVGLYRPETEQGKGLLAIGRLTALFMGTSLAFLVLFFTVSSLGIWPTVIGGIAAFAPVPVYLAVFLWLDRYDPEPFAPLTFAFSWGALLAILVSGILNGLFGAAALSVFSPATADTLTGIISAPIVEEATKGLGVLLTWMIFRKDFDSIVDGIVYAGVCALGFAAVENIDYYGKSYLAGGTAELATTFVLRGVLAPFSHVLFTCMTGIGCGVARETHDARLKVAAPLLGYGAAMVLHAVWNTLASFSASTFYFGYLFLEVPLFALVVGVFLYLVKREGRILRDALAFEVQRGLLTQVQLDTLVSSFKRFNWTMAALGNTELWEARRQFLRTAAKLGLCHWHVQRALSAQAQTASFPLIPRLQAEIFTLREKV